MGPAAHGALAAAARRSRRGVRVPRLRLSGSRGFAPRRVGRRLAGDLPVVRLSVRQVRRRRRLELRAARALPTGRPPDRQPRLLCDRRAARTRAAEGRRRSRERRRRRQVGDLGRRPHAQRPCPCCRGARERHALRCRCAQARAGDRAARRLPGHVRAACRAAPPWPRLHLLRDRLRGSPAAARGRLRGIPRGRGDRPGPRRRTAPGHRCRRGPVHLS